MKNLLNEIKLCEVCNNTDLVSVLDLGLHPMCDDLVPIEDNRVCCEYPIEILYCTKCFTAHQRFQVPKQYLFPNSYHYRSRFTNDVLNGMAGLVNSCVQQFGDLSGKMVLDIGCNDGSLLDFFKKKGLTTIGIEPTGAYIDAAKNHVVLNNYLTQEVAKNIILAHGKPDFITFTNVFAHIEDLKEVLKSLRILMKPNTVIIIENHYLGAILEGNQFDTFYHEHPRTYSYNSFVHIAKSLDAELLNVEFTSRYGGNIRIFLGKDVENKENYNDNKNLNVLENNFLQKFELLNENIASWKLFKGKFLRTQVCKYGKLKAKAFPGRAAILIKLLGLNENHISAVYEKPGSFKISHYVPGTRIPICGDTDLFSNIDNNAPLLNMAWHISGEIRDYLCKNAYTGQIIDILSINDFKQVEESCTL